MTPLKLGQHIKLCRGEGPKSEYNGQIVSVLEYPSNGIWMTVGIRGTRMKWKKKDCEIAQSPSAAKEARLLPFDDDLLCTIFGFLVGPSYDIASDKKLISVEEAGKLHSTLTTVCTRWRTACNNNMFVVFGLLDVNFTLPNTKMKVRNVIPCIFWMIKHKVAIGSINFEADYGDILILEKLFNACDTSELTSVRAHIHDCSYPNKVADTSYSSLWVVEAYTKYVDKDWFEKLDDSHFGEDFINNITEKGDGHRDDGRPTLKEMSKAVRVPHSDARPELRQLHDTIAFNCKNISELDVDFAECPEDQKGDLRQVWENVSNALFSLPSVQKLKLGVKFYKGISYNIHRALRTLVNLQELSLRTPQACDLEYQEKRAIFVASKTLKSLDISKVVHGYVFGVLPNLKTLFHDGPFDGIVPEFIVQQRFNHIPDHFLAREATMYGLKLPPDCNVVHSNPENRYKFQAWMPEEVRATPVC